MRYGKALPWALNVEVDSDNLVRNNASTGSPFSLHLKPPILLRFPTVHLALSRQDLGASASLPLTTRCVTAGTVFDVDFVAPLATIVRSVPCPLSRPSTPSTVDTPPSTSVEPASPSMRCLSLSSHHARTSRRIHLLAPSLMIALRLLSWSPPFLVSDRRLSAFHGSFHDKHI